METAIDGAPAPTPEFSELLRGRLDDLARQSSLTGREREVFELLVLGRSAHEMATVLGITARTVKFHQQRVLEKIGADTRLDILRVLL
ncbi:MAG: helix-turn-helix transcriptional regulator [Labilithrix sp.]|nr:helix-turn-helix transcriptional regulator [Labilithrix sp.]MCW5810277.1 helix-turn-helix transcriptional regulator [Labilithrix sp.]